MTDLNQFDIDAYLNAPPVRIERRSLKEVVGDLEHTSRAKSQWLLVDLLERNPVSPRVAKERERIRRCRRVFSRYRPSSRKTYDDYDYCDSIYCPNCTPRKKREEARRVWNRLCIVAGGEPKRECLSYVTFNDARLPLGSDHSAHMTRLKDRILYAFKREWPNAVFSFNVHIAVQRDGKGGMNGMDHLHGVVYHEGVSRAQLRRVLRQDYGFKEHKALHVRQFRPGRLERQVMKAMGYAADIDLSLNGHGDNTPNVLVALLESYMSLQSRGRMGLRFQKGLRMTKAKVEAMQIAKGKERRADIMTREISDTPGMRITKTGGGESNNWFEGPGWTDGTGAKEFGRGSPQGGGRSPEKDRDDGPERGFVQVEQHF